MPQVLACDKSTLVNGMVIACCLTAPSLYMSQYEQSKFHVKITLLRSVSGLAHPNREAEKLGPEMVPDSKVHGANMGPTWVLSAPDGPHVGPMNLAIMGCIELRLAGSSAAVQSIKQQLIFRGFEILRYFITMTYLRNQWGCNMTTPLYEDL